MEQKRILWIIAAVGVFLLVVLGGALIIYSPSSKAPQSIAKSSLTKDSDGWVSLASASDRKPEPRPFDNDFPVADGPVMNFNKDHQIQHAGDITVYADNATVVSGKPAQASVNPFPGVTPPAPDSGMPSAPDFPAVSKNEKLPVPQQNIYTTTNVQIVPSPVSAGPAVQPVKPANQRTARDLENAEKANSKYDELKNAIVRNENRLEQKPPVNPAVKPSSQVAQIKPAAVSNASSASKTQTNKTAPSAKKTTQYWIQVASLSSRKNADSARDVLGENKITADVFTYKDNSDKLYYRVRVGPYTTRSEAEYWRTEIARIDTFAKSSSYVTSTVSD